MVANCKGLEVKVSKRRKFLRDAWNTENVAESHDGQLMNKPIESSTMLVHAELSKMFPITKMGYEVSPD